MSQSFSVDSFNICIYCTFHELSLFIQTFALRCFKHPLFGTVIIGIVSYESFGNRLNSRLPELLTVIDQKLFTLYQVITWYISYCKCARVSLLVVFRASVLVCPYSLESCVTEYLLGAFVQIGDRCYFDICLY